MRNYIFNLETTKIELYFDKSEYDALSQQERSILKSAFLWSNSNKCWVSRAKEPHLYRAKEIAVKLGFTEEQREGERISYAEQLKRQAKRAEERAERYEEYAGNAERRGSVMQKPLNSMRGDIAFFTQPVIAGHSGSRAFANRREKMLERYNKGFEEYHKGGYFRDKAQTAGATTNSGKFKDKGYLYRRIKECKKEIRDREKRITRQEKILSDLESGEKEYTQDGIPLTIAEVTTSIRLENELLAKVRDKKSYLEIRLDEIGGIQFSKDNIKIL